MSPSPLGGCLLLLAACGLSPATAAQILRSEATTINYDGEMKITSLDSNLQALTQSTQRHHHCPNPPQKRYELLRDFVAYMTLHPKLRWTLGQGSLLGAMRQKPPGFMTWDDDLDIFLPAEDLFELRDLVLSDNASSPTRLGVVLGADVAHCCGFGWRFVHRNDECAYMDLWNLEHSQPLRSDISDKGWATRWAPESRGEAMMSEDKMWSKSSDGELTWLGERTTSRFFPDQCCWMLEDEFLPLQQMQMYDLSVNIPNKPWALLDRWYGASARDHDSHGHVLNENDLKPAAVNVQHMR